MNMSTASAFERERALDRAGLPIEGHGGLGLIPARPHRHAYFAGRFTADWPTMG